MNRGRLPNLTSLSLRQKLVIGSLSTAAYALLFVILFPAFGVGVTSLSILPVAATAWLFGPVWAILAAAAVVGLDVAMLNIVGGLGSPDIAWPAIIPRIVALLGVGWIVGQVSAVSQRLRTEIRQREQTERAMSEERTLSEALRMTANNLTSTLDIDELMQRILNNVWRVVPHDAANIMLIEGDTARVVGRRGYKERGLDEEVLGTRVIINNLPSFKQMVDNGQALLIADTSNDARWIRQAHTAWIQSFVSAPIRIDNKVVGAINLDSGTTGFFTPADGRRLEAFADQAAIAIRNARLYGLTMEKVNRLELVSRASQAITAVLDLEHLLRDSVRLISETFGYYNTMVMLVDGDELVVHAASHESVFPVSSLPHLKIGTQGITGWVAAKGEPLLVPDISIDPRYFFYEKIAETRSELAVPIRLRELSIGVLDVQSNQINAFNETDVTTLRTLADQLAIGIQNARLVERIQRRERYLDAIARVERHAAPERDPRRYLQAIATSLYQELDFSRVLIMLGDDALRELSIGALCDDRESDPTEEEYAYRQAYDTGILGRVMVLGKPYLARDTAIDPYFVNPRSLAGIACELAVPIRRRGQTVGVLTVQSTRKDNFDNLDLTVMAEVGEQLGINLENVELNDALRRHADELEDRVTRRTSELQAAKERLEELDKMKSKFVADVSHELRIPVTNLSLYIDLLEHGVNAKRAEYVHTFREQVTRLATLVESILNLSRLELGKTRIAFVPVDMNKLIEPVIEAFGVSANDAGVQLKFSPAKKLPEVLGEPGQLTQVISNLLSNALRYTSEGVITVSTEVDKKHWQVIMTVRDTGMGIAEEDLPHLFERFYRGKGAAQTDIPGTGLGLAITKEIIDIHSGTLDVESTPGKGSAFHVTLPMGKFG